MVHVGFVYNGEMICDWEEATLVPRVGDRVMLIRRGRSPEKDSSEWEVSDVLWVLKNIVRVTVRHPR